MFIEGSIGAFILGIGAYGFKMLQNKTEKKVDIAICKKIEEETHRRLDKGEEMFNTIMLEMKNNAIFLGRIDERLQSIEKTLNGRKG